MTGARPAPEQASQLSEQILSELRHLRGSVEALERSQAELTARLDGAAGASDMPKPPPMMSPRRAEHGEPDVERSDQDLEKILKDLKLEQQRAAKREQLMAKKDKSGVEKKHPCIILPDDPWLRAWNLFLAAFVCISCVGMPI
jgi:hypothetical protein